MSLVTTALVRSRINPMITCYRFSTGGEHFPVTVDNPYILHSPYSPENQSDPPISVSVLPCRTTASDPEYGKKDNNIQGIEFLAAFALDRRMCVSRRIYSTRRVTVRQSHKSKNRVVENTCSNSATVNKPEPEVEWGHTGTSAKEGGRRNGTSSCVEPTSFRHTDMSNLYNFAFNKGQGRLCSVADDSEEHGISEFCSVIANFLTRRTKLPFLQVFSLYAPLLRCLRS